MTTHKRTRTAFTGSQIPPISLAGPGGDYLCLFCHTFATPQAGNWGPVRIFLHLPHPYICHPQNRKLGMVLRFTFAPPQTGNWAGSCTLAIPKTRNCARSYAYFTIHLLRLKPEIGQGPVFILLYICQAQNRKSGRVVSRPSDPSVRLVPEVFSSFPSKSLGASGVQPSPRPVWGLPAGRPQFFSSFPFEIPGDVRRVAPQAGQGEGCTPDGARDSEGNLKIITLPKFPT